VRGGDPSWLGLRNRPPRTLGIVIGYATPEDAARAESSVPAQYSRVVAVDYSPDGSHAIVCLEYNEPPVVEPYVVLCENTPSGWIEGQGGSGGGVSWMATSADRAHGVEVAWGTPPTVRWDIPPPGRT
jgi:hypothetical protein